MLNLESGPPVPVQRLKTQLQMGLFVSHQSGMDMWLKEGKADVNLSVTILWDVLHVSISWPTLFISVFWDFVVNI